MINCIAIDDEPLALDQINKYCSRIDFIDLKKSFTRTSEAEVYLKKFPVDLILLDIQMPDISGIDFYRSLGKPYPVIFTTAYSEYAVEGFDLNAVDYLLKPIKFDRFEKAVRKTKEYLDFLNNQDTEKQQFLFVRSEYRLVRIPFTEILYIEGLDNYVRIFTALNRSIISHMTMKALLDRLPKNKFMRVHRSYIIQVEKSISIRNRTITIGDIQIPVGLSYLDEINARFGKKLS